MRNITRILIGLSFIILTTGYDLIDNYKNLFIGLPYNANKNELIKFIHDHKKYQIIDSFKGNFGSSYYGRLNDIKDFTSTIDSIRFYIIKGYEFIFEGNKSVETFGTTINYSYKNSILRDSEFARIVKKLDQEIKNPVETFYGDETSKPTDRMEGYIYKLTSNKFPLIGVFKTTENNINELIIEFRREIKDE